MGEAIIHRSGQGAGAAAPNRATPPAGGARERHLARWSLFEEPKALVVSLAEDCRALGWAPLGGGLRTVSAIVNHQLEGDAREACERPEPYLRRVVTALGLSTDATAALMTGAPVDRAVVSTERFHDLVVTAFATAGCSNALRVGDSATSLRPLPGTINLIVVVSAALTDGALVEAVQIAAEAKALATWEAGVASVVSGRRATGTGTDCIVVASPVAGETERYCGKHTKLGELIGRAVLASSGGAVRAALSRDRDRRVRGTS